MKKLILFILMCLPGSLWAAVSFDAGTAGAVSSGSSTHDSAAITVANQANRLLIAFVGHSYENSAAITSCAFDPTGVNESMTQLTYLASNLSGFIYYRKAPSVLTSKVVRCTGQSAETVISVVSLYGVDQTNTFQTTPTPTWQGGSGTHTLTVTDTATNDMMLSMAMWTSNNGITSPFITWSNGETELTDVGLTNPNSVNRFGVAYLAASGANTSAITGINVNGGNLHFAIGVKAAAAAAATSSANMMTLRVGGGTPAGIGGGVQACTDVWTITAQQPITCLPYPGKLWDQPIPANVASYQFTNGDLITAYSISQASKYYPFGFATPGKEDFTGIPMYYGQSTDPIFKIISCLACGSVGEEAYAIGTYWHIPSGARFSATHNPRTGDGDSFLGVWDQTNRKFLKLYLYDVDQTASPNLYTNGHGRLPTNCTATTTGQADADANCQLAVRNAQVSLYATGIGFQYTASGGDSLFNGGAALLVRHQELMQGQINHALYLVTPCVLRGATPVFPAVASSNVTECAADDAQPTKHFTLGNLVYLDYTAAEIDALKLPADQTTVLKAFAKYGAYVGDTSSYADGGTFIGRVESGEAYQIVTGNPAPIYAWLDGRTGWTKDTYAPNADSSAAQYNMDVLANISGVSSHIHIAAECIAKTMAGTGTCP